MTQELPNARRSRVLLIGATTYEDAGWEDIPGVAYNLYELRNELLGHDEHDRSVPSRARLLHSPGAEEMKEQIRSAAGAARDLLLIYFSGHGHLHLDTRDNTTELYLVPSDCPRERVWEHAVSYTWLRNTVRSSRARQVVLILDCCYSGQAHRVEEPGHSAFALLTSARARDDQDQGNGVGPTPFTRALLVALRALRTDRGQRARVEELLVRMAQLSLRDKGRAAVDELSHPNDWEPALTQRRGGGNIVLSHVSAPRGADLPDRLFAVWLRLRSAWWRFRGWRWWPAAAAGAVALALLAALLPWLAWDRWQDGRAAAERCAVPLQLRVLTTPEYQQPLSRALAAFDVGDLDEERRDLARGIGSGRDDCRRVEVQVYGAPGAAVVDAFEHSADWASPGRPCAEEERSEPCRELLRDVGPLPDVWLPASSATADRVRPATRLRDSRVELGEPTEIARVPAVVAANGTLPDVARTGESLTTLLEAAGDVRSAAPQSSDAALAHGMTAGAGRLPDPEPVPDDAALVCSLRPDAPSPDLLLSERSMLPLVGDPPAACLPEGGWRATMRDLYTAYYPSDVPPLDLSFVPVRWRDADRDAVERQLAVELLGAWLAGEAGGEALRAEGFRRWQDDGWLRGPEQYNERPFVADLPRGADVADADRAAAHLAEVTDGAGPRDVVFVLDVSNSVLGPDGRLSTVRESLRQAIGALTDEDRFAVLTTPGADDVPYGVALDLGPPTGDRTARALDALTEVRGDVRLQEPMAEAAALLTAAQRPDAAGLLVVITDDGHRTDPQAALAAVREEDTTLVVSVLDGGCDRPVIQALTTAATCLDDAVNQPVQLAAKLRVLGEG
ncbi:VWA domain-containing protein [Streptomyces sp. 3MP-14]|uniref:VWA domain-containing protein n=1 Tax=Streptomyces mimosae TaxID=2586635 RepID=A0A5N6A0K1_9ACTN|nr:MULTISPECIES: VWA domain-containing protein [Streptomyces]KAB8161712.1 VWA domain-containing protein [Streptomyces mimosae]KAB8175020.1 VWA domain-containing protein [Streptomyces sp. 3MP-14]